jgi:hypothetical protein
LLIGFALILIIFFKFGWDKVFNKKIDWNFQSILIEYNSYYKSF